MKRFTYLLLLLSPLFTIAQKRLDLVHENAFAFYDYQEKAFCVLDDSTFLWKYNVKKEKWEKSPIELHLEMSFERFLSDFIAMSEKGSAVYFVYKGCGVVYAKRGTIIHRNDHSFYHMNQFTGAFFMDNGEPRIYGGYGLFTNKNIVTRYDTIECEWFVISTGINQPPVGIKNIVQKQKKNYFIFDGLTGIGRQYVKSKDVWRLDLKTLKWINIGKLNPNIQCKRVEYSFEEYQIPNNGFSCFENAIITYDLNKMRFKKYRFNATGLFKNIIHVDSLFLIMKTTSLPSRFIVISDSSFLNRFDLEEGEIIQAKSNSFIPFFTSIFVLLTLFILFFVWHRKKRNRLIISKKAKMEKGVDLNANEFNQTEIDLLQLLLNHQESGLEISYINDLVNHDQPSLDTLKKRREILLKDLRYKLALKFNIPQEEVLIEKRMETDKRMKLLFLNELVKIKM
jgi:hypothetical protein